jgi:anti-sigma factor ChrR (cupin superfamily)
VTGDAARAALYALGALPADEASAFEAKLRTSPGLRAEVDSLRAAAGELALAADPVPPGPAVRQRVLDRAREAAAGRSAPPPDLWFTLHDQGEWITHAPGLELRELFRQGRAATYLLRVAPDTRIPRHEHRGVEHSYVLSGSIEVAGQLCREGDYHRAAQGTVHEPPYSPDGCVMLIVAEQST